VLTLQRCLDLFPDPPGQLTHDERHDEHHEEGEQIRGVMNPEGVIRRHKPQVERGDAQEGGEQRRAPSVAVGDDDHGQQKKHGNVGDLKTLPQQKSQRARQRNHHHGPAVLTDPEAEPHGVLPARDSFKVRSGDHQDSIRIFATWLTESASLHTIPSRSP
jgi:hypothetical protein